MKASVSFSLEIDLIQSINDRAEKGRQPQSEVATKWLEAGREAERQAEQTPIERPPLNE